MTGASGFLSSHRPTAPAGLIQMARQAATPRVAIARAGAPLPMLAAKEATDAGLMIPVFTGEAAMIQAEAHALEWDISGFDLIEADGEEASGRAAALACGEGRADILMKGQLHTDVFMRAALSRDAGLRTGTPFVHIFHITSPDGASAITISDAAVNVTPNFETRKAATRLVVDLLHKLGNDHPKVAFLSATESVLEGVPSSVEARALRDWAQSAINNASFEGPLAFDLIMSPEAVATKGIDGNPVAGRADAIMVPDIVSGNALFKSFVYLKGGCAAGVVLGAKVPILLTSRADPAAARLASIALGVLSASAQ